MRKLQFLQPEEYKLARAFLKKSLVTIRRLTNSWGRFAWSMLCCLKFAATLWKPVPGSQVGSIFTRTCIRAKGMRSLQLCQTQLLTHRHSVNDPTAWVSGNVIFLRRNIYEVDKRVRFICLDVITMGYLKAYGSGSTRQWLDCYNHDKSQVILTVGYLILNSTDFLEGGQENSGFQFPGSNGKELWPILIQWRLSEVFALTEISLHIATLLIVGPTPPCAVIYMNNEIR